MGSDVQGTPTKNIADFISDVDISANTPAKNIAEFISDVDISANTPAKNIAEFMSPAAEDDEDNEDFEHVQSSGNPQGMEGENKRFGGLRRLFNFGGKRNDSNA